MSEDEMKGRIQKQKREGKKRKKRNKTNLLMANNTACGSRQVPQKKREMRPGQGYPFTTHNKSHLSFQS